jgi:hypothetical protein
VKHRTLLKVFGQYGDVVPFRPRGRSPKGTRLAGYRVRIHGSDVWWTIEPGTPDVRRIFVGWMKCPSLWMALGLLSLCWPSYPVGPRHLVVRVRFTFGTKGVEAAGVRIGDVRERPMKPPLHLTVTAPTDLKALAGLCRDEDPVLLDWIMDHHDAARDLIEARSGPSPA